MNALRFVVFIRFVAETNAIIVAENLSPAQSPVRRQSVRYPPQASFNEGQGLTEADFTVINIARLKTERSPDDDGVKVPCTGICADVARGGIFFIGDSSVRRLYVRMLARIYGLTNYASELLQNNAKVEAHKPGNSDLAKFRDDDGNAFFDYNKEGMRLRYLYDGEFDPYGTRGKGWTLTGNDTFRYILIGFPTAHMLHNNYWGAQGVSTVACLSGSKEFPNAISKRFEELVGHLEEEHHKHPTQTIIFGNGPPYAKGTTFRDNHTCEPCDKEGACHEGKGIYTHSVVCKEGACDYGQDNTGVDKANRLYHENFIKLARPFMRFADRHDAIVRNGYTIDGHSDGGVHYTYQILDKELDVIMQS